MSFDTHKTWTYNILGKKVRIWQVASGSTIVELAGYKLRLPQDYIGKQLVYPTESITNGLLFTGTASVEPFVEEALETTTAIASGTTISFNDDGDSAGGYNDIYDTGDGFGDFLTGDKIRVRGSTSNDGDYTLTAHAGRPRYIQIGTGNLTDEAAGARVTISQIPVETTSPSVESGAHVNCTRLVALAIVDFIKSQVAERGGNIELKEYYMKEFWGKIADNKSNRSVSGIVVPRPTYAVI